MALTWKDRIKVASATTGTGTLTLGAAASGYQTFAAGDDGLRFDIVIEDGTAWETARNCLYTHSGTTLTRGTFSASSTGSALSLSGAENVFVDLVAGRLTSDELAIQTYIAGLIVTKNTGGNTLDISAGACYDPSSNKIISYAGATAVSAGSLGASQWNQVYIYDNAGTVTIEVTNNANPPSTTYAGTARQGGTNSNRRWIGSFYTDGSSNIVAFTATEAGANRVQVIRYDGITTLNSGSSTTYAAVSLTTSVPRYVTELYYARVQVAYATTGGTDCTVQLSSDGTNESFQLRSYVLDTGAFPKFTVWLPLDAASPQIYYKVSGGGTGPRSTITSFGYYFNR